MAETKLKKKLRTDFSYKTAPPPRNYFVPNFGVDSDVRATQASIKGAEASTGKSLKANFGQKDRGYPINYSVPSFGADPEITASQTNLINTEKKMNHKINLRSNADVMEEWGRIRYEHKPALNLGPDQDIVTTQKNIELAKAQLGAKKFNPFSVA